MQRSTVVLVDLGAERCLVSYLAAGVLCPSPTSSPTTHSPWNCIVAVIIIPVNDPTATDSCSCALTGWCPKTRDADFSGRCRECQGQPCRDRVSPGCGRVMASQYVHHGICQSWSVKGTPGARPLRLRPSALGERQDLVLVPRTLGRPLKTLVRMFGCCPQHKYKSNGHARRISSQSPCYRLGARMLSRGLAFDLFDRRVAWGQSVR